MSSDTTGPESPPGGSAPTNPFGFLPQRSFGLKLLLVCALALLMAIPALFVFSVVYDRSSRASEAEREVSQRYGGAQTSMGPVLILPYTGIVVTDTDKSERRSGYVTLYPETGSVTANIATERKKSGIHEIPVYAADIDYSAQFNPSRLRDALPYDAIPEWENARLIVSMSDSRAARDATQIRLNGEHLIVEPVSAIRNSDDYNNNRSDTTTRLASTLQDLEGMTDAFTVDASMSFSGAREISLAPFARNTTISLVSDWPDPKFTGGFQQKTYTPGDSGFEASWSIPYEARGIPGVGSDLPLSQIIAGSNTVSVRLVDPNSPYQSVQRALKYALMFIGFVFLAYFLFEVTSRQKAHPAQYVLVGLAQSVFYLMLLALSEQAGFDLAFLIAAIMTVGLTSAYAITVFRERAYGYRALGVFSGVYALIYTLMRLEDYALLIGAFVSFIAIGFTMYMTRDIDWYGTRKTLTDTE